MTGHACTRRACASPAPHSFGVDRFCDDHFAEVMAPIRQRVFDQVGLDGVGRLHGRLLPEYGPLYGELVCTSCGATWEGPVGDACWWCDRHRELLREHQGELLLAGVDVDPADERFELSVAMWGERLERGVEAGLIERSQASRAWRGAVQHVA